jgi:HD superfamily phosphohydrolase
MSQAEDAGVAEIATRLRERKLFKTLDMAEFGEDPGKQRGRLRRIKDRFADKISAETVMLDDKAAIGIYAEIGGDEERMHKKLHILDGDKPVEISKLSPLIEALQTKKQFTRLYFADQTERDAARQ